MDQEVASFCAAQIRKERFPFLSLHRRDAFSLLAKNFKDCPEIVEALDEWVEHNELWGMEVFAAGVGRTAKFKKKLLELLTESFPHWPAKALLDIWGVSDRDVAAALDTFVGDPEKASMIGHLLPQIIIDKQECRQYLLRLLRNPVCKRPDFVLRGLVELGASGSDVAVVDAVLELLSENRQNLYLDEARAKLIVHFFDNPRVRKLAKHALNSRDQDQAYIAVAQACGTDNAVRASFLRFVTPLPARLRQVIASHLAHADVDDGLVARSFKELRQRNRRRSEGVISNWLLQPTKSKLSTT